MPYTSLHCAKSRYESDYQKGSKMADPLGSRWLVEIFRILAEIARNLAENVWNIVCDCACIYHGLTWCVNVTKGLKMLRIEDWGLR